MRSLLISTPHPVFFGLIISRLRWAGHVTRMGERRVGYWVSVGTPE